jgi:hypothetical protein
MQENKEERLYKIAQTPYLEEGTPGRYLTKGDRRRNESLNQAGTITRNRRNNDRQEIPHQR